jgi:hypothetical protein
VQDLGVSALATLERPVDRLEEPPALDLGEVERAGLDEALEPLAVDALQVHPLAEVEQALERAALARGHGPVDGRLERGIWTLKRAGELPGTAPNPESVA